ncbi:hypothetical protein Herod_00150 [Acinetobacter phage Herod]|nr:hypothetical protein Herod_00150 [Acinetobacter phage Herod]
MQYYQLGDVVEVVYLVACDSKLGVKVGDVAKVVTVRNYPDGSQMVDCYNPKWDHEKINGVREMTRSQLKKVK